MEIEELQERYSDLEKKYDSLYRENILLKDKIKQMAISKVKLKIDLVAEVNYPPTQSDGMGFKPEYECKEQDISDFSAWFT